jgi:alkylation response protein AidB-like acyl-CoA dehydrogenase
VDFELSTDQRALQEAARQLLDDLASPSRVRAHLAGGAPYDSALWSAMAEQGWCTVAVPEVDGGLGLGWVEAAVLLEEVGRHTAPVPFAPALVTMAALSSLDPVMGRTDHRDLAVRLMSGTAMGTVAWSPAPDALARSGHGDTPRLTGRLGPVEGASTADVAIVIVPDAVYLVDLLTEGRPTAEPAMDLTRSLSWLSLASTPARRIGGPEDAARLGALGAVATSAELLGGAQRVLELATQYAKDRIQFGVPIGSFQAVKHRCADMLVDVEGMRSVTWYAAWAVSTAEPGWELAAATAKVWCAEASRRVMASGLQVHGGIGFTWDHDLHLYLKRAQFAQLDYGDAAHHRTALARGLRQAVLAGRSVT